MMLQVSATCEELVYHNLDYAFVVCSVWELDLCVYVCLCVCVLV